MRRPHLQWQMPPCAQIPDRTEQARSVFLLLEMDAETLQNTRPQSLVFAESLASIGAERTPVREHRSAAKTKAKTRICGRADGEATKLRTLMLVNRTWQ